MIHDLFTVMTGFYADIHKNWKLIADFYSHFTKNLNYSFSSICKILGMISAK